MSTETTDYSVCPAAEDGKHVPQQGPPDRDLDTAYLNIECALCGVTTGHPVPPLEEITW